jgi:molybdate transport system ATP-binding protein
MSEEHGVHAKFYNELGGFTLDVDFKAPAKGVTAIFGPSGCGKTTVIRCIAGLIRVKDGYCKIDGEIWQTPDGAFVPTHKRPLGYVFQEASLFPHMSVRRNLLFGAPKEKPKDRPAIDFDEVIDLLGVRHLLDRAPSNLSGGERQRIGIGRALLTQPKVLLMDEPLSALDRKTKSEILPFIEKLRDHFALPIFYITHDMSEVERLADQVVLIEKGRVVAVGPLEDVESDPASSLAVSREAAVTLHGVVTDFDEKFGLLNLAVPGGKLAAPAPPSYVGEPRRIRILARDVSLAREAPRRSSILNVLPARIVSIKALDRYEALAVVTLGEQGDGARLLSRMSRKSSEELGFREGQNVFVQVKYVALGAGRGEPEE